MPELPEVETIKLGLKKKILGLEIKDVVILSQKSVIGDKRLILGTYVTDVWRRGKVLGVEVVGKEGNLTLLFHLKMSGQIIYHPIQNMLENLPNTTTRVIITFQDHSQIFFNDQRKFGWMKIISSLEVINEPLIKKMGPEPLEESFDWQQFRNILKPHKNLPIKIALLDQSLIAGIGNIYASEACFTAKISPMRKIASLTDDEYHAVYQGIIKVLKNGIKLGGSTRTHFVNEEGKKGLFLEYANVYAREGTPCKRCKKILKKIKLAGRGTVFCESCQI